MNDVTLRHIIKCEFTGLEVGVMDVYTTAGAIPYLSHWNECVARHPVFSLSTKRLFEFANTEWNRLAKKSINEDVAWEDSFSLRASYVAILHSLDCVKQDHPALPPLVTVQNTLEKLFELAWWKFHLESKRFRFPTYHINKYNDNLELQNIDTFLDLCFDIKRDYETKKHELIEQERIKQAERAMLALRNSWVTPVSKKVLWSWVRAHLPKDYHPDAEGWLSTLFLGGSAAIIEFEEEDINLAEEIIVASCPIGTMILHAVRQRLETIRRIWDQHNKAYEINLADFSEEAKLYVNGELVTAPDPGPEPRVEQFESKAKFYIAHAKWTIAKTAYEKGNGK